MAIRKRKAGGFNTFTACISTTMVLVLIGTVAFFISVADNFGRSVRENLSVEILLSDSISQKQTKDLQAYLSKQVPVKSVTYTSKEQVAKDQSELLGSDPEEFYGVNFYPASFELLIKADYANKDSLNKYLPAIKSRPFVTEVILPDELMDDINRNIHMAAIFLLSIALLQVFVSLALINNTMRFSAYANRYTIYTMRLLGARQNFIRRPYLRQAFWIGFVASLLALSLLAGALQILLKWDAAFQQYIDLKVYVVTCSSVAIIGILLTVVCAFFSVTRILRLSGDKIHLQ